MERYFIKKALADDIDAVVKLYDDVNEYYIAPGWGKGEYPTFTTINGLIEKGSLYVLTSGVEVLGAGVIDRDQHPAYAKILWSIEVPDDQVLVIHDLVSHPKHRKKGIGKKLVEYAISLGKKENAKTIRLDAHLVNTPARNLYEKCGFHEVTQWTGVISNVKQTFCVFECLL